MSDMIPLIASAADLPDAIRYAQTRPTARWYVAKQAVALGVADLIPADWRLPLTAAAGDLSQKARDKAADEGEALPDGSFPIRNAGELEDAIHALGRAKDSDRAKRHIIKRARALDALDKLPDAWGITASAAEWIAEDTDETVELEALVAASARGEGEHLAGDLGAAWDEALHPRGRDGKWITKGGKINVYNLGDSHRPALQATAEGVHNDPKLGMVITARVTTPGSYQGTEHRVGDSMQVLPQNVEEAPEARAHLGPDAASAPFNEGDQVIADTPIGPEGGTVVGVHGDHTLVRHVGPGGATHEVAYNHDQLHAPSPTEESPADAAVQQHYGDDRHAADSPFKAGDRVLDQNGYAGRIAGPGYEAMGGTAHNVQWDNPAVARNYPPTALASNLRPHPDGNSLTPNADRLNSDEAHPDDQLGTPPAVAPEHTEANNYGFPAQHKVTPVTHTDGRAQLHVRDTTQDDPRFAPTDKTYDVGSPELDQARQQAHHDYAPDAPARLSVQHATRSGGTEAEEWRKNKTGTYDLYRNGRKSGFSNFQRSMVEARGEHTPLDAKGNPIEQAAPAGPAASTHGVTPADIELLDGAADYDADLEQLVDQFKRNPNDANARAIQDYMITNGDIEPADYANLHEAINGKGSGAPSEPDGGNRPSGDTAEPSEPGSSPVDRLPGALSQFNSSQIRPGDDDQTKALLQGITEHSDSATYDPTSGDDQLRWEANVRRALIAKGADPDKAEAYKEGFGEDYGEWASDGGGPEEYADDVLRDMDDDGEDYRPDGGGDGPTTPGGGNGDTAASLLSESEDPDTFLADRGGSDQVDNAGMLSGVATEFEQAAAHPDTTPEQRAQLADRLEEIADRDAESFSYFDGEGLGLTDEETAQAEQEQEQAQQRAEQVVAKLRGGGDSGPAPDSPDGSGPNDGGHTFKQTGDPVTTQKDYANHILDEAYGYQDSNREEGDTDPDLDGQIQDILDAPDDQTGADRAQELQRWLTANGYADGEDSQPRPGNGGGDGGSPTTPPGPADPTEARYQAAHQAVKDAEARGDHLSDDPRDVASHNRLLAIREKAYEQTPAGKQQAADQAAAQQAAYERDLPGQLDASRRANAAQADRRAEHQATDAATAPDDRIARMSDSGLRMIAGTNSPHADAAQTEISRREALRIAGLPPDTESYFSGATGAGEADSHGQLVTNTNQYRFLRQPDGSLRLLDDNNSKVESGPLFNSTTQVRDEVDPSGYHTYTAPGSAAGHMDPDKAHFAFARPSEHRKLTGDGKRSIVGVRREGDLNNSTDHVTVQDNTTGKQSVFSKSTYAHNYKLNKERTATLRGMSTTPDTADAADAAPAELDRRAGASPADGGSARRLLAGRTGTVKEGGIVRSVIPDGVLSKESPETLRAVSDSHVYSLDTRTRARALASRGESPAGGDAMDISAIQQTLTGPQYKPLRDRAKPRYQTREDRGPNGEVQHRVIDTQNAHSIVRTFKGKPNAAKHANDLNRAEADQSLTPSQGPGNIDSMTTDAPVRSLDPQAQLSGTHDEVYRGERLRVRNSPTQSGLMLSSINGHGVGSAIGPRNRDAVGELDRLRSIVDDVHKQPGKYTHGTYGIKPRHAGENASEPRFQVRSSKSVRPGDPVTHVVVDTHNDDNPVHSSPDHSRAVARAYELNKDHAADASSAAEPRKAALRAKVSESQQQRLRDQGQANWNNHVQHQERAETARRKAKGLDEHGNATRPISTSIASNQLRVAGHKSASGEGGGAGFKVSAVGGANSQVNVKLTHTAGTSDEEKAAKRQSIHDHFQSLGYDTKADSLSPDQIQIKNRGDGKAFGDERYTPGVNPDTLDRTATPIAPSTHGPQADRALAALDTGRVSASTSNLGQTLKVDEPGTSDDFQFQKINGTWRLAHHNTYGNSNRVEGPTRDASGVKITDPAAIQKLDAAFEAGSKAAASGSAASPAPDARFADRTDDEVRRFLGSSDKQVSRAAAQELARRRGGPAPAAFDTGAPSAPVGDLTDSQRINRLVTMHGSDRSNWSLTNLRLAAKAGDQQAKDELERRQGK